MKKGVSMEQKSRCALIKAPQPGIAAVQRGGGESRKTVTNQQARRKRRQLIFTSSFGDV
jgi:hypothetical protein